MASILAAACAPAFVRAGSLMVPSPRRAILHPGVGVILPGACAGWLKLYSGSPPIRPELSADDARLLCEIPVAALSHGYVGTGIAVRSGVFRYAELETEFVTQAVPLQLGRDCILAGDDIRVLSPVCLTPAV